MTKNEIRVLSLAKLRLFPDAVVYDIGAGSGSVAIECKLLIPEGQVWAIEKNPQAIQLIKRNIRQFEVDIEIVEGEALDCLNKLPPADRIFIGGSGGRIKDILVSCDQKLKSKGIIVINSVSLKTSPYAFEFFSNRGYEVEAVQANIACTVQKGSSYLWQARNPVTIITAQKRGEM